MPSRERPESPRLGRRRFVRVGVVGSVALGRGGVLAWQTSGYEVPASIARRLRCLSAKEHRIVEAVADRVVRSDDDAFPSAQEVDVAVHVDAPSRASRGVRDRTVEAIASRDPVV